MAKYWIKLYHEVLDDPKMGKLPDWLWRRAIELFLLAGKNGNDGALPSVEEMGWILRLDETKLRESLQRLAEVGVVHEAEPDQWIVTNFAKRQDADTTSERVSRYRKEQRKDENRFKNGNEYRNETVTKPVTKRYTDKSLDKELKTESEQKFPFSSPTGESPPDQQSAWKRALKNLRESGQLVRAEVDTWLKPAHVELLTDGLQLYTCNHFGKQWIENHAGDIEQFLSAEMGHPMRIQVLVQ